MQQRVLLSAFLLLCNVSVALTQSTTSSNPLGAFLGSINSAVGIIQSASASAAAAAATVSSSSPPLSTAASSSSPSAAQTVPTSSPSSSVAPSHHGSSNKTLIIAVVCAVVGALLLGLVLLGICCCLLRRRRKTRKNRVLTPVADDEIDSWKSEKPRNPGRTYIPSQYGRVPSAEHEPVIPPLAAGGRGLAPSIETHPAYRPENPFVPVPPSPRRSAPNSRSGLTDGTVPGDKPYIGPVGDPEKQRLRTRSHSRSHSRPIMGTGLADGGLPTHANPDRPSTPFGLSGIGQPYDDMHVHVLRHDAPSQALRQSLDTRDPLMSAQPRSPTPGYSTPPDILNRSPHRSGQFTESPYTTASDNGSSTASDEFRPSYAPATSVPPNSQPYSHRLNYDPQFQQQKLWQPQYHPTMHDRHSSSPITMQPPSIPWSEPSEQRRQSPTRTSAQWAESGRRASRSPATSINGQPRRLRFSDVQASPTAPEGWDSRYGHSSIAHAGVGEAM